MGCELAWRRAPISGALIRILRETMHHALRCPHDGLARTADSRRSAQSAFALAHSIGRHWTHSVQAGKSRMRCRKKKLERSKGDMQRRKLHLRPGKSSLLVRRPTMRPRIDGMGRRTGFMRRRPVRLRPRMKRLRGRKSPLQRRTEPVHVRIESFQRSKSDVSGGEDALTSTASIFRRRRMLHNAASMTLVSCDLDTSPICVACTLPPLNSSIVGAERTP